MPFSIRKATVADSPGIAKVHVQSWQETYKGIIPDDYLAALSETKREAMWSKILSKDEDCTLVAVIDGKIIGFANGGKAREPHGFDGELNAIYLLSEFQKRGIGRALFTELVQALKQKGFSSMYLWVLRDNDTARFYRSMGGIKGTHKEDHIGEKTLMEDLYGWGQI